MINDVQQECHVIFARRGAAYKLHLEMIMDVKFRKILIAIDVLDRSIKPSPIGWKFIQDWIVAQDVEVEAVYVHPAGLESSSNRLNLKHRMNKFFEKARFLNLVRQKILVADSVTAAEAPSVLAKYALEQSAEALVVMSHGRKFLRRWIMGSFAETLLKISPVPVVFLGKSDVPSGEKRILFATDFSPTSYEAFQIFLDEFADENITVILCHAIPAPLPPLEDGVLSNQSTERKWVEVQMKELVSEALSRGIQVHPIVEDVVSNVPKTILKVASRENVSLVGIVSKATKFESAIFGTVAKKIFRSGKVTTWVCGPALLKGLHPQITNRRSHLQKTKRLMREIGLRGAEK